MLPQSLGGSYCVSEGSGGWMLGPLKTFDTATASNLLSMPKQIIHSSSFCISAISVLAVHSWIYLCPCVCHDMGILYFSFTKKITALGS